MTKRVFIIAVLVFGIAFSIYGSTPKERLKVGLVLGGGGAKGAAEVGVLKVIEALDIPIDYIAGTSIGAIVGGLYSCGYTADQLDALFRQQEWLSLIGDRNKDLREHLIEQRNGTTYILGFPLGKDRADSTSTTKGFGILRGEQITHLLDSLTSAYNGIESFDRLPIPFRCVAVDIKTQEEVIMDSCEIELAMRASMAIPGAFKPVRWKGHTLVDGGMLNNLPVDVVKAMGADVVIAIDLQQEQHEDRDFSLKETFGIGGLLDWAVSRPDWKKNNANRASADVYICPDLSQYSVSSFGENCIESMIELGEQAGTSAKEDLLRLKRMVYSHRQ